MLVVASTASAGDCRHAAVAMLGVILFCASVFNNSGPTDDAPEPHRLKACVEIKSQAPHAIDATSSP